MRLLFQLLNIFPKECIMLKPKEQKLIKVKAPFIDEISGLAIIKILDGSTYSTMLLKLKFIHNSAMLDKVRHHNILARTNVRESRFEIYDRQRNIR